jgi:hypothetical protein
MLTPVASLNSLTILAVISAMEKLLRKRVIRFAG